MSIIPTFSGTSSRSSERRRHARMPPGALLYLDIGTDNGGIVTDLTEDGAGVQAVSPLDASATVGVRLQAPDSQARIDAAEIVWVSDSRLHGGLKFPNLPEETRVQIRGWLRALATPIPVSELSTRKVASPVTAPDPLPQNLHKDKWSNLLSVPQNAAAEPSPATEARQSEISRAVPRLREPTRLQSNASASFPLHGFLREIALLKEPGLRSEIPPAGEPRIPKLMQPGGSEGGRAEAAGEQAPTPDRDGATRLSASMPGFERRAEWTLTKPGSSIEPASSAREDFLVKRANITHPSSRRNEPAAHYPRELAKWAGIGIAGAALCVASFGVGRWLAITPAIIQQPKLPTSITNNNSQALPGAPLKAAIAEGQPATAPATPREGRSKEATGNAARPSTVVPSSVPGIPLEVQGSTQTVVASQIRGTPAVISMRQTKPDVKGPSTSSNDSPTAVVVQGRVLSPLDRFNPAHLTYRFDPAYPDEALAKNIQGTVMLHLAIDANGSVENVTVLSGPAVLTPAAVAAAKNWRYLPALLNGEPVQSAQDVRVDFHLPKAVDP